ncbi:MAG: 5-formyltetrahydrofolate cyclo-ligase [Arenimonas sp.]|nr:5-formyltetrahydrofolate cyclo-ligase [Arenimonas sp.]MBP6309675.1 5-formyltetrahydrofolate cyclo-ligase [Arenimonas sp.]
MRQPLRQALKAKRNQISVPEKMAAAEAVAQHILAQLPESGGTLAAYWACSGELPLHILQMRLPSHWIWCLPVVQANRQLLFAPWRPGDELVTNQYGIPEPTLAPSSCLRPNELSAVLVPLLGFTRHGQRLGMGGGFYDASFAFRKNQFAPPKLIGVGFACQEIEAIDGQDWDVNMDAIATEHEWINCHEQENIS